jgi:DNA-directed RNA polymerase alpha subunit
MPRSAEAFLYWRQRGLSTRAANALAASGIATEEQLRASQERLPKIPNLGRVSLEEIQGLRADRLAAYRSRLPCLRLGGFHGPDRLRYGCP